MASVNAAKQRATVYQLDSRLMSRRSVVMHIIQLERVAEMETGSALMLPGDTEWVLTERYLPDYVDLNNHTRPGPWASEIGRITRILATSSPMIGVKHFELHLFGRAYMGAQVGPFDFGPNNCACPTGEADLSWKENFYLPSLRSRCMI